MNKMDRGIQAVLNLHCIAPKLPGEALGPYCAECVSPIDGGPELYPCLTVKVVMDAMCGSVCSL